MVLKYEIKAHDGPGRYNKLILGNNKSIDTPNLIQPVNVKPYHIMDTLETLLHETKDFDSVNHLTIGHLPPLHLFSKYDTTEEVIDILKETIIPKIENKIDIISFPLDKAASYRLNSQYAEFINQVQNTFSDSSFACIYSFQDTKTDWKAINNVPLVILGDLSNLLSRQRKFYAVLKESFTLFFVHQEDIKFELAAAPTFFLPLALKYQDINLVEKAL